MDCYWLGPADDPFTYHYKRPVLRAQRTTSASRLKTRLRQTLALVRARYLGCRIVFMLTSVILRSSD
ncbi:hypothetical protein MGG_17999 [Pyricularia oryzae 70-15]|uniref:Uncharacterized protein n=2 Tax=Pyricularia oryzae TaxID=318829 RepID=G4NJE2_PYRO7|nr:uncharacterized protein MGG_17999 [Pyricularia oryzae 70-15]EHA46358.1 hypothetical protein MGG_17999 [Pyricularia oryzae 70-15]ELQ36268.1 hypothetical protein OOU_Y34scaffold00666g129 [Pyricularia oryzae Y34]